jgi:hypothetical protein
VISGVKIQQILVPKREQGGLQGGLAVKGATMMEHNNRVATLKHEIALRLNLDLADPAPDGTFLATILMRGHDG